MQNIVFLAVCFDGKSSKDSGNVGKPSGKTSQDGKPSGVQERARKENV